MKNMIWDMQYELAYGYFKKYGNLEIKQSYVTKNRDNQKKDFWNF